jgi:YD repeat-containing protein
VRYSGRSVVARDGRRPRHRQPVRGAATAAKRPLEWRVPTDQDADRFIVTPAPVYDRNDNVTKATAPNGAVSTAVYDKADQLLESNLPKDTTDGPERKATFAWDLAGNLKNGASAADFTTNYVYDQIYQLTQVDLDGLVVGQTDQEQQDHHGLRQARRRHRDARAAEQ